MFFGRTVAKAETPICHLMRRVDALEKTLMLGGIGGKRRRGRQRMMEKGMASHSSVLTWRIPGMEKPGRLQSMGLHRVGHD